MTKIRIAVQSRYGESNLRKGSKTWSCILLLSALLNFSGCDQIKGYFAKGGGKEGHLTPTTMPVNITNCAPETGKDPITLYSGDTIQWTIDGDYFIQFDPKFYTNTNTPVSINPGSFFLFQKDSNQTKLTGKNDCSDAGCYFKYNIFRVKSNLPEKKACNDPGIRILPGSSDLR